MKWRIKLTLPLLLLIMISTGTFWLERKEIIASPTKEMLFRTMTRAEHPDSTAKAMLQLAMLFIQEAKMDSARLLLEEAEKSRNWSAANISKFLLGTRSEAKALLLFEEGKYDAAKQEYLSALQYYRQAGPERLWNTIATQNNLGRVLITQNNFEEALKVYQEALSSLNQVVPSEIDSPVLSTIYNNVGAIFFYESLLDSAQEYYDKSRTIATMCCGKEDVRVGRALYNLGMVKESKGYFIDARYLYEKALDIYIKQYGKVHQHVAEAYGCIGNIHLFRNELQSARYYFEKDLETATALYGPDHVENGWGLENIGKVYEAEGKDSLALVYLSRALELRKKGYGETHTSLADNYLSLSQAEKNLTRSTEYARKALDIEEKITPHPTIRKWYILLKLSENALKQKDLKQAKVYLDAAQKAGNSLFDSDRYSLFAQTYLQRMDLAMQEKNWTMAFTWVNKAMQATLQEGIYWNPNDILPVDWIKLHKDYLLALKGKVNLLNDYANETNDSKYTQQALKLIDNGLKVIREMQRMSTSDEADQKFDELFKEVYELGLSSAVRLWETEKKTTYFSRAFFYAEKIKNGLLSATIYSMDAYRLSNVPEATLRKEYQLKKDIKYYSALLEEDLSNKAEVRSKLQHLYQEQENFYKDLKKFHSEYYRLKYDNQPISVAELQKKILKPGEALYHITRVKDREYLFLITREKSYFKNSISTRHDALQQAVAHLLTQKGVQKLIVIPDMKAGWPDLETRKTGDNYLVEQLTFLYNSSATLYAKAPKKDKLVNEKVLAFAPVNFETAGLNKLKYSETELKDIAQNVSLKAYIGKEATVDHFLEEIMDFGVLHLSTHARINSKNPLKSALYFSPSETNTTGMLYAHDLFGIPMRAQLVTLSACQTADSTRFLEGVSGIADAFVYNGCNNILMTLWDVDDKASHKIISRFYRYLSEGKEKDKALQLAKADYLKSADRYKQEPFYWAGIVLYGDITPFNLGASFWSRKWELAALLVLIAVLLYRRR